MNTYDLPIAALDELIEFATRTSLFEYIRRDRGLVLISLGSVFQVLSEEEALVFLRSVIRVHLERSAEAREPFLFGHRAGADA